MRLSTYLIGVPVVLVTSAVAIANRQIVTFSLDPFSLSNPSVALSVRMPLFVLLIATLALGAILGGAAAVWSRRGRAKAAKSGAKSDTGGLPARTDGAKPPAQ